MELQALPETMPADRAGQVRRRVRVNLQTTARNVLDAADDLFARLGSRPPPQGSLIGVLFHSLYRDKTQLADHALAPNQDVTVEDFRRFVAATLESGCTFVSPAQVDAGLAPGGKYAMITFDDGYFNNTLALKVLEEFQVPAAFFISSGHVLQNKAFWWDAFSRGLSRHGACHRTQRTAIDQTKTWTSEQVEVFLRERYGGQVLCPHSDLDRPFTPAELRDFARHPWVHLGNHTSDHAILTNCTAQEVSRQVRECQAALTSITGQAPVAIAYPNGNYTQPIVDACLDAGLRVGFTTRARRNDLPLDSEQSRMTLGRFLFTGGKDPHAQSRRFNAAFLPSEALKRLIGRAG
jgi:peptidoglycan/xylan/chitin deacetylase (PgdA/CDA1 family)